MPLLRTSLLTTAILLGASLFAPQSARAQTVNHDVFSNETFALAITAINLNPTADHRISLSADVTLSGQVPPINISGTLTVEGDGHFIDGDGAFRPFHIASGDVELRNLTITNAFARGGNGGAGGGGGLGAGAAVFVETNAYISLKNVNFTNNRAEGGDGGGAGSGGNGGGLNGGSGGGVGSSPGTGGDGIFGGGGGAGGLAGGNGGFGGGGGGSSGTPGASEYGGGDGGTGGGGGAAFGGALFIATGGYLVIEDALSFSGNSLLAGGSNGDGGPGEADGSDLFLMSYTAVVFDISAGNTLTFAQAIGNYDGTFDGVDILKAGDGTLILTGNSEYVYSTYVAQGTLVVDGSLSGFTTIEEGATLRGTGTLEGLVENYGRVAPGSATGSIGTLNITGAYLQGKDGVYEVDINDAGQSDQIAVDGVAVLSCGCVPGDGGDLYVVAAPGNYTNGTRYTILTTTNGVYDRFGTVTNIGFTGFTSTYLEYDDYNVYLVIDTSGLVSCARTFNQRRTAISVMSAYGTADPEMDAVMTELQSMNCEGHRGALDQLSGELFGTLSSSGLQVTDYWHSTIANRLRPFGAAMQAIGMVAMDGAVREPVDVPFSLKANDYGIQLVSYEQPASPANPARQAQVTTLPSSSQRAATTHYGWVSGYGVGGGVSSDGNAQAFNYGFGGTTFGVDRYVGGNTIVGLAGGYAGSRSVTDTQLQEGNVSSLQAAIYASRLYSTHYLLGIASYSHDEYATTRQLPANLVANGQFGGYQLGTYVEGGLMRQSGAWNWQPLAALQYISLHQDGFTETGAGGAGLTIAGRTDDSLRGMLGVRFAKPTQYGNWVVIPTVQARYGYEFLTPERFVTANFAGIVGSGFTTAGNQLGRNFGVGGVGVNIAFNRNWGAFGGYDLLLSDRSVSNSGNGGLQLVW